MIRCHRDTHLDGKSVPIFSFPFFAKKYIDSDDLLPLNN
jgi:hypothetical protein